MPSPTGRDPFEDLLRAAVCLLAAAIAVQFAVAIIERLWLWLVGGFVLAGLISTLVAYLRWHRNRW